VAGGYFVDENDLALGKALAERRDDVVFPGRPALPEVPRQSLDDEWLAVVGARQLVVITRDQRIRYRPVEKARWRESGVRGFVLTGRTSQSTTDSLELLERHWNQIEGIVQSRGDGPWMFAVTKSGLREISLSGEAGES
jgi:hypothetical protein